MYLTEAGGEGKDDFPREKKKTSSAPGHNTHSFCDIAQISSQVFVSPEPRGDDLPPATPAKSAADLQMSIYG